MENQNEIVNVLGDAAPLETTVSEAHVSLNVVVQALKTIPAVDVQKVQQKMTLLNKFHRVLEAVSYTHLDVYKRQP